MIINRIFVLAFACLTAGCMMHSNDPLEKYNRTVHGFNTAIDKAIIRPIVKTYAFIIPKPVDQSIGNFFSNLNQINTVANDVLQVNAGYAVKDTGRFAINSTLGILGLFDIASKLGLEQHTQDFGLTLAKWGIKDSPYFVLPFLGPSTLRDAISLPIDYYTFSAWPYIKPSGTRYTLYTLQTVHQRKVLLATDKLVDESFDPYVFVRSAYLQKRAYLMRDPSHSEADAATNIQ